MKKTVYIIAIMAMMAFFAFPNNTLKANKDVPEQEQIHDGREYWIGFTKCNRSSTENVRWGIYPIELWVSSKVNTMITMTSADGTLSQTLPIQANRVRVIYVPDFLEMKESEVVQPKGVHIIGKDPINVSVFYAYKWTGEAYRCTPVEWLGTKYYTLNMYQDRVKMASGSTDYHPAQIVIVATEDNTVVKYRPTADTEGGVKKGETKTVKMNKGETFLILAKVYPNLNHDWATDLSGTYIEANKPIAVISGHTKGAFPRFREVFLGSLKSDFMRNMMVDAMWPVELLGREYISAPIKYLNRYYNAQNMVEDLKGDIIRFVATVDNTIIYQMRQDGSGFYQISPTMKAGQWYDITNQELAAYYRANHPVLVGQYGKAWWSTTVGTDKKDDPSDAIQNPPRNGQGMMFALTPIEQWTNYSVFRVPFGMDNFVYFTFKTEHFENLYIDGKSFPAVFGNVMKEISGTPYSYVTEVIGQGDHFVEGRNGAKFAGYAYGNWDYSKDGFAYGYPIGINYSTPCVDSIYIIDQIDCGDATGTVYVVPPDSSCAIIYNVWISDEENYNFEVEKFDPKKAKVANYYLTVKDKSKPAKATVYAQSRSGNIASRTYEYFPEQIEAIPDYINFGLLALNETKCQEITLRNPGRFPIPVTVKEIKLKFQKPEFELKVKGLPYTLQPGEKKTFEVCGTALQLSPEPVEDSIYVELTCYELPIAKVELRTGEPVVWIGDATWKDIPVNNEKPQTVRIINESNLPVELYTIKWNDKLHFTRTDLKFPIVLQPYGEHRFTVWYKPDKAGATDIDTAWFTSNAEKRKLYSVWIGNGIEAGPYITGYDWYKRRVIDDYSVNKLGITEYPAEIEIDNYSESGTLLDFIDIVIENDFNGVFRIDKSKIPLQLKANNPIKVPVFFAPKTSDKDDVEEYVSTITFIAEFNKERKTASAELRGIEMQPHINIEGHDYGAPVLVGTSVEGHGTLYSFGASELTKMPLSIFDLKIIGPDADAFEIDPDFFVQNPVPTLVIQPGDQLPVPIKFTAKHPGIHTAYLVADHDAPEDPRGELIGRAITEGVSATDHTFPIRYITTKSPEATVYFTNLGTKPAVIDHPLSITGDDQNFFQLIRVRHSNGTVNPQPPITVNEGESLALDVVFTPFEVRKYHAQILYNSSAGNAVSNLWGEGMIHKVKAQIPDKYIGRPGEEIIIDVNLPKHEEEQKALELADIKEFKAMIYFRIEGRNTNTFDVFPSVINKNDIITNGTMTDGWQIITAEVVDERYLYVHMESNEPLKGTGTLFKFPLRVYLSDIEQVPLPVDFDPVGKPYVFVTEIPGLVKIQPVCVNTLRLVKVSGVEYSLSVPMPNPVERNSTIEYSIGLEANVKLTLFDSYGNKVAELINQNQSPGKYQIDINVDNLPSGTYYYKLESGPFTETRQMVIIK